MQDTGDRSPKWCAGPRILVQYDEHASPGSAWAASWVVGRRITIRSVDESPLPRTAVGPLLAGRHPGRPSRSERVALERGLGAPSSASPRRALPAAQLP